MGTQTIGLFEAKTHLSELVARAEQGDEVIITRHNKPVAKIVPVQEAAPFDADRRRRAVAALQKIGRDIAAGGAAVTGEELADWVREGREERAERIWAGATRKKK